MNEILDIYKIVLIITVAYFIGNKAKRSVLKKGLITILGIGAALIILVNIAYMKGCSNLDSDPISFLHKLNNSPFEDQMPDNEKGKLFILYSFDCPDCVNTHDALIKELNRLKLKPYFISVQSKQGRTFLNHHKIQVIPSGLYIDQNGSPTLKPLYYMQGNTAVLNKANLKYLYRTQLLDQTNTSRRSILRRVFYGNQTFSKEGNLNI